MNIPLISFTMSSVVERIHLEPSVRELNQYTFCVCYRAGDISPMELSSRDSGFKCGDGSFSPPASVWIMPTLPPPHPAATSPYATPPHHTATLPPHPTLPPPHLNLPPPNPAATTYHPTPPCSYPTWQQLSKKYSNRPVSAPLLTGHKK